jgi:hypothetical protein
MTIGTISRVDHGMLPIGHFLMGRAHPDPATGPFLYHMVLKAGNYYLV